MAALSRTEACRASVTSLIFLHSSGCLTDARWPEGDETAYMRLTLNVEDGSDPASGWVETEDGRRHNFVGMIELLATLATHEASFGPPTADGLATG